MLAAFAKGLHVFCEKPLCYGVDDIDEVIAARDRAGKVLQVGYMKRFDPSYEAALRHLPGTAKTLRYISVEVNDPDAWPFIRHHAWRRGDDVPAELVAAADSKQREQVARAVSGLTDPDDYRGFVGAYCSSIVHDVNAVHGLLDALGIADGEIVGAQLFAGGEGGQGAVRLLGGQALWNMVHLAVPTLADYRERITLYFDDAVLELEFPSPWLNHQPTRLTIRKSDGHTLVSRGYPHRLRGSLRRGAEGLLVGGRRRSAGAQHGGAGAPRHGTARRPCPVPPRRREDQEKNRRPSREGSHWHQPDHLDQ